MLDNAKCPHGCNSLGKILWQGDWVDCPLHGKPKNVLLTSGKLPNGVSLYDVLQIPYEYQGDWVTDIERLFMNQTIIESCLGEATSQLQYILETLYNVIGVENSIYMNSLYIYANPALLDLKPFVYTIQRMAFENNLSVLPAITINDLCGLNALQDYGTIKVKSDDDVNFVNNLNRLAGQGADWSLRTNTTYTDYLRCSICIVFDSNNSLENNLRTFSGFLEERARRGLPTYVFSTAYFDMKRENMFYDKTGKRSLSCLTPYLLLGKGQELYAREHGWLSFKGEKGRSTQNNQIDGFGLLGFNMNNNSNANDFDL